MNPTRYTFTPAKPIREMVAASFARTEAVKVKLLALLMWTRAEAKRILKALKATVATVLTVDVKPYLVPATPLLPATVATQPAPVAEPAVLSSLAAKSAAKQAATCGSHFCPMCHKTNFGNIVDNVWSCPCCPFRLNLVTGETVKPFDCKPEKSEYIRITAEYVSQVMARSNTTAMVKTSSGWQI